MANKKGILPIILLLSVLLTVSSCSDDTFPSEQTRIQKPSNNEATPSDQLNSEICNPNCVGNQIGQTVPPYKLHLSGTTSVTSDDLISRNKPVFLFFFTKW